MNDGKNLMIWMLFMVCILVGMQFLEAALVVPELDQLR